MDEYIPGDDPQKTVGHKPKPSMSPFIWVGIIVVALVIVVAGGYSALAYLRHGQNNSSNTSLTSTNGSGGPQSISGSGGPPSGQTMMKCSAGSSCSGAQAPTTGTVTAVSSTSITIQPSGSSTTKTYTITSSTGMASPETTSSGAVQMQGNESFNASDVHIGEIVAVMTGSNSSQAQMIILNPPQQTSATN
jgi:hypothetical protein